MTLVDRAVWQIETKLRQPLSLTELSTLCAVSPFHLSRTFRSATGFSPMTYLRARRLSAAAEALANGDEDILTIALEAQYGSHEAFTRAFASYFGLLPSSVRAARSVQSLVLMEPFQMKKNLLVDVAAAEIKERDAFRVVGLGTRCTFEDTSAIPPLWQSFNEREKDVPGAVGGGRLRCLLRHRRGRVVPIRGRRGNHGGHGCAFRHGLGFDSGKPLCRLHPLRACGGSAEDRLHDLEQGLARCRTRARESSGFRAIRQPLRPVDRPRCRGDMDSDCLASRRAPRSGPHSKTWPAGHEISEIGG